MSHTFLFEPAVWSGTGTLWRADGEPLKTLSRTEIAHRPECWLLSGTVKVLGSPPTEFVHAYLIQPPKPGDSSFKWTFESATLGKLEGRFAVIGPSILSVFVGETSGYHGVEHLGQRDPDHYRSAGVLMLKGQIIYSWEYVLTRGDSTVRERAASAGSDPQAAPRKAT